MILLGLLNSLVPGVFVAAVAWAALRASRVNAATRYWAWWAVVVAVIALPFWPAPEKARLPLSDVTQFAPLEVAPGTDWLAWAAIAWVAFALYRLMQIAFSYARLRSIRNNARTADASRLDELRSTCGVNRAARLLISSEIASPIAIGFLHPAVILPESLAENLTPAELDHVLLHELAHIARRDDWTNLAGRLIGAVLGIHPVIAFALNRIEKERELACDDWVVAATGEARTYAASLARIFELSRGHRPQALASSITGSRLGDRVEQLLAQGRRFTRDASIAAVILMAALLAVMVVASAQSPAWVAFAQERIIPPVAPLPPVAPQPPAPPLAPVAPRAPIAPPAPVAPVAPVPPSDIEIARIIADRQAYLRAIEAQMRARQAQMEAERNQFVTMEENLRARAAALQAELVAIQKQLEQAQREKQF